jgi:Kef-type K+ transport system membrane component KefB
MQHIDVPQYLGLLVVILGTAKAMGAVAQRIGQPAVLGELVSGVVLGASALGMVDPTDEILHLLAEIGIVVLLFEIGLETDLNKLLRVGGSSLVVAIAGVVLPFLLGYAACWILDLGTKVAIVAGATLTATSVGITARVLSDLNRLQEPESQIVLGAAVIDDVIGLVILAVVTGMTHGEEVTVLGVLATASIAFGFLAGTIAVGKLIVPQFVKWASRFDLPGTPTMLALMLAFGLGWLASEVGSAVIVGAFAAGLLLKETPQAAEMERGIAHLGHFFVPIFFVSVGAAVDIKVLNPLDPANYQTLLIGGLLIIAAVVGKFIAGYAAFWFKGRKHVIGLGMIPRGEVGLIFAQMGAAAGVFVGGLFSAITLMVMVTTFMAPPLLKLFFPAIDSTRRPDKPEGIEDLVTEA